MARQPGLSASLRQGAAALVPPLAPRPPPRYHPPPATPRPVLDPPMRLLLATLLLLTACQRTPPPAETPATTRTVPPPPPPKLDTPVVPPLPPQVAPPEAVSPGDAAPMGHPELPAGHAPVDQKPVEVGTFPPAQQTIAQVHANRAGLAGQAIEVRGRVMKVNHHILGRNWLHLRDPSGEADLVVTTQADASRGDLVRVKGTLALDRDVGAGFKYDALLEDATVVVEPAALPSDPTPPK